MPTTQISSCPGQQAFTLFWPIRGPKNGANFTPPSQNIITKDAGHNKVLECAVAGKASYIVTADAHLKRKTRTCTDDLFGSIYGDKSDEFRLKTWRRTWKTPLTDKPMRNKATVSVGT